MIQLIISSVGSRLCQPSATKTREFRLVDVMAQTILATGHKPRGDENRNAGGARQGDAQLITNSCIPKLQPHRPLRLSGFAGLVCPGTIIINVRFWGPPKYSWRPVTETARDADLVALLDETPDVVNNYHPAVLLRDGMRPFIDDLLYYCVQRKTLTRPAPCPVPSSWPCASACSGQPSVCCTE